MKPRILVLDDDPGTLASLARAFALEGYETLTVSSAALALKTLEQEPVDAVLSDVVMPDMDGVTFLARLRETQAELPVILMSGHATLDMAVKATRLGALDFVEKPVALDRLLLCLRNALRLGGLARENRELRRYWQDELALVGDSAPMLALRSLVEKAAPSDVPILILGENGTGKELVARAVHELSPRRPQPFVKMNCAAIPAELVESELFGHEKGSFSGAVAQRRGRFEQADGGTLFLDEIGDMPPPMQAKLLRVLQDGEVTRVGSNTYVKVDVRVIAATNKDPEVLIAAGTFREDLFYRISTVIAHVPPLRQRAADIPALVRHFAAAACRRNHWPGRRLGGDAVELLAQQPWKGNVRELRNVVERVLILSESDPITPTDVKAALPSAADAPRTAAPIVAAPVVAAAPPEEIPLRDALDGYERDLIRERLRRFNGHVTNAARSLGLERSHLYKKCRQLGVDIREES
jgi:two-component system, NtrC family, nitrogen regulation response regulator NtrX